MLLQDGGGDTRCSDVAGIAERAFGWSACFVDAGVWLGGEGLGTRCCRAEVSAEDMGDGDVRVTGLRGDGDGGGQDGRHGWGGLHGRRCVDWLDRPELRSLNLERG